MFNRSIFGLASLYNKLPQELVDINSVKGFQSALTKIARARCENNDTNWKVAFNVHFHYSHRFSIDGAEDVEDLGPGG